MAVKTKICCISSVEEAMLAIRHGANALGLVGHMPSGPGTIDDDLAREIASHAPRGVETFLLTERDRGESISDHAEYCGTTTVQIVRHIDVTEYPTIAKRLPMVRRVQVIHVEDNSAIDLVKLYEPHVHGFVLDSGRPGAAIAELGGTGRPHDWRISASIVRATRRPVYLAGGLDAGNVRQAIHQVQPYGLDLCSGVRTANALDESKLETFMNTVRNSQDQT